MNTIKTTTSDILIIGSGAAGLSVALRLAPHCTVQILSKESVNESATFYAQGGIAAVFDAADSIDQHIEDTLIAGAGLCDRQAVTFVATHAKSCVEWLVEQGVEFDTHQVNGEKRYHLTQEGGHSHRRILHAADATGRAVETTLVQKALSHPNIDVHEYRYAIDLMLAPSQAPGVKPAVTGAWVLNHLSGEVECYQARAVILATGGASRVYQYTTNPDMASGDGIAMAWRAGCEVANLEFNQFHPTALFHPGEPNFLLTEALRGEGAYLRRPDGSRFMPEFDRRGELAPRDIVARAIDSEMKRLQADCMYLDISHQPAEFIRQHFPNIVEKLSLLGFDLTREPVPIVPAAHYTCGGVRVDQHGRTGVEGLYAIGEVSYTGLHGANRMASNSLLECLVYGWSAASDIISHLPMTRPHPVVSPWPARQSAGLSESEEREKLQSIEQAIRRLMWNEVGIVRRQADLRRAHLTLAEITHAIGHDTGHFRLSRKWLAVRNQALVAELVVRCALARKESRGLHACLDYPETAAQALPSILTPLT